jgi:ribosomal protein S27AE
MQSITTLVNSHNDACPKCGAGISGDAKTCGSCGSVRLQRGFVHWASLTCVADLPGLNGRRLFALGGVVGEAEWRGYPEAA